MAKENTDTETSRVSSKLQLIQSPIFLVLLNTGVLLGVGSFFIYSRFIYKRPSITEQSERHRLVSTHEKASTPARPGILQFEPFTVNIQSAPSQPKPADGTERQIQGKLHYATVSFTLILKDLQSQEFVEKIRLALMDRVLSTIGRKTFNELVTVQGRYILKNQLISIANQLSKEQIKNSQPLVTQLYFTQFTVQ
jgi:flagellar basal body-associated protein FliL